MPTYKAYTTPLQVGLLCAGEMRAPSTSACEAVDLCKRSPFVCDRLPLYHVLTPQSVKRKAGGKPAGLKRLTNDVFSSHSVSHFNWLVVPVSSGDHERYSAAKPRQECCHVDTTVKSTYDIWKQLQQQASHADSRGKILWNCPPNLALEWNGLTTFVYVLCGCVRISAVHT